MSWDKIGESLKEKKGKQVNVRRSWEMVGSLNVDEKYVLVRLEVKRVKRGAEDFNGGWKKRRRPSWAIKNKLQRGNCERQVK